MSSLRSGRMNQNFVGTLSLYTKPPDGDISLEDFQQFAVDRLRILRVIEEGKLAHRHPNQVHENVCTAFNETFSQFSSEDLQRADLCSHFILRLAFCQREDLRRWFLTMECDLFTFRFNSLSDCEKKSFLRRNELPYQEVTKAERRELKQKLAEVFFSIFAHEKGQAVLTEDYTIFFKVPFEKVPELLPSRRVYLQNGFAYVPRDEAVALIVADFRESLLSDLNRLSTLWFSEILSNEADRLVPIIESVKTAYTGPDFIKLPAEGTTMKQDLVKLSKTKFPLCMKNLFDNLLQEHHLKHNGRQQLSLFLKGIGLSLEDALQFWKEAFHPRVTAERFEKDYAYNIRHNYGREGKRAQYIPYSCLKIISSTPGVGDHHGCPFKTFTETRLHQSLIDMGVQPRSRQQIVSKTKERNYQVACCMAWEGQNGQSMSCGINHPNQYFKGNKTCQE